MKGGSTLIVAVSEYSFEQAANRGFYARPSSHGHGDCSHIAFYRTAPISAITHYAEVNDEFEEGPDKQEGVLSQADRIRMFPDKSDEPAQVFLLEELVELERPVERDDRWVQGSLYGHLEEIKSADHIDELL